MSKQEFLDSLRRSLAGGLEYQEVNEHIRYYSDYIDSQIRMGISEEEVMTSLGEPRLIAKTLLGMDGTQNVADEYLEEEASKNSDKRYFNIKGKMIGIPGWLFTIGICLICFCVLTLVFALVTKLMPVFIMIMAGVFIYRFLKNFF